MKHGSAEISHASAMRPSMAVAEDAADDEYKSLGTIQVPSQVLDGRDLGETVSLMIHGVYTAKDGKQSTLHLLEVKPVDSKNHADREEKRMRGETREGDQHGLL